MATKKSKSSNKSQKTTSTKSKTATKTAVKPELEAPKTKTVEKTTTNKSCLSGFFARKYEGKESILTIFKNPKFYGSLLGELIGTLLLTLVIFAILPFQGGVYNIINNVFAVIAILVAVYAFSGSCLNPLVAVGMMASRRISVIRGVMYIIAEIIGAWLGWMILNGFHLAGGETAIDIPGMAEVVEGKFWPIVMVELLGSIIIAFVFARALKYKRSVFTFAVVVAGGIALAYLVGYVASAGFLGVSGNFVMNPAVALMLQIFPTAGENFGEILGGICQALSIYALFPMVGGVIGFYLSDFTSKLSSEE
ncbi:aquaporin [Candidatus Saccharibacteria bacterium]|nr:aquaporin [Candidatus Saccharibacteria bacterium]